MQFHNDHLQIVKTIFTNVRDKLIKVFLKYKINYKIPTTYKSQISLEVHKLTLLRTVQSKGEESDEIENEETDSELDTKSLPETTTPLINTLYLPVPISENMS